ncbi:MAG: hypothetical protein ND895_25250 [Pyrinomonadaceae bacterium]|nr:hypothetical protein [Pyrinomonadaceae bacterium]
MFEPRNRKLFVMGRVFWIIALCCALTGAVFADDDDERPNLQGTWRVTLLPGAPNQFFSLMEFHKGGTMTEEASSPNHTGSIGVWKKIRGHGNFAATFELFRDSDGDEVLDGRFRVRLTIHLLDDDTMTGTFTVDLLTLDGTTQVGGPFPGLPLEGTRMKVMRE